MTYAIPTQLTKKRIISGWVSLLLAMLTPAQAQNLVITGVVDGPLTGGVPKAIELCVLADIADLSIYGLGSANNGGGSDGEEFTFPAGPVAAGTFIYVASESSGFTDFFGFAPGFASGAASINGDDAIELFMSGGVADVYGDIDVDGSGEVWDYADGWAYRSNGTGPDGSTFVPGSWSFSGINALDGETSNSSASTPFPVGQYSSCSLPEPKADLLLSEIVVTPTGGEFIEIFNPTAAAIDLSNVYLTDATFAGGGVFYYNMVTGAGAGGGGFGDFHARFPDGATIGPGEFQTVALNGSANFVTEYGTDPTYELYEDGAGADAVADMREALPGSINGQGGLSNSGEIVILYAWDGASDLVEDIDYAVWGDKVEAVDKSLLGIDGPDADGADSFFAAETAIVDQDVILDGAHAGGDSFQRVDFSEGTEAQTGGNGVTGDDETSENLSATWSLLAATPGAAPPTPAAAWVINEILADPASGRAGDANSDGFRDSSQDEFVEIVNVSGADTDISGWTLADGFSVRHTFPAGSVVPDGCSVVVFGGGAPSGAFGISPVQTASSGSLGLNNGGDTVTLNNGASDVATATYGSEGGNNQSLTLDPDLTGAVFVQHGGATGSGGSLFSPGTNIDGSQFEGCPPAWVINEIHADPESTIAGDANGDGTRSSSADEFVEIVNRSGADVDISGWTLADGFSVRHTFPAGSIVFDGCSVVVFGGGAPTGDFGNSVVQTASGGSLGLNNGGDSVSLADGATSIVSTVYGGEGGDNQSLTLDPDVAGEPPRVKHSIATGSGGTLYSPGTKVDGAQHSGCPVSSNIYDIQGSGLSSPLEGERVLTVGVVTAVGPDGFFIQTVGDGDPDTSDGVFVFTGSAPTVAVGDEVEVNGVVDEFFGMTELAGTLVVTVIGAGAVPPAVVFDANVPSPDPANPSCAIEYECYEGMLVEIPAGIVAASNQEFGSDPFAEVHVTAQADRPYREPGIEYPGIPAMPAIPVWDGNPEVFELDPDKLGLPNLNIPAGSTFSAAGVIGFEFNHYEFWPHELNVSNAPLPVPVRQAEPYEATIGSLNLLRLFDDVDDPETMNVVGAPRNDVVSSSDDYGRRLAKAAAYIVDVMRAPDIIAVQEVEKLGVLDDLSATILLQAAGVNYTSVLIEGNDVGTIDVGFLVRDGIRIKSVEQLGADERFTFDNPASALHDRPPLLIDAILSDDLRMKILVLHMRSLGGIETERTQRKRLAQALSVAQMVEDIQAKKNVKLAVIGDFNAFEFTDGYVDVAGIVKGEFDPAQSLICASAACPDIVSRDLIDEVLNVSPEQRYSFIFRDSFNAAGSRGDAQVLDHVMTSGKLAKFVTGLEFARGNADAAEELVEDDGTLDDLALRASDHDGLVLYVCKDDKACDD